MEKSRFEYNFCGLSPEDAPAFPSDIFDRSFVGFPREWAAISPFVFCGAVPLVRPPFDQDFREGSSSSPLTLVETILGRVDPGSQEKVAAAESSGGEYSLLLFFSRNKEVFRFTKVFRGSLVFYGIFENVKKEYKEVFFSLPDAFFIENLRASLEEIERWVTRIDSAVMHKHIRDVLSEHHIQASFYPVEESFLSPARVRSSVLAYQTIDALMRSTGSPHAALLQTLETFWNLYPRGGPAIGSLRLSWPDLRVLGRLGASARVNLCQNVIEKETLNFLSPFWSPLSAWFPEKGGLDFQALPQMVAAWFGPDDAWAVELKGVTKVDSLQKRASDTLLFDRASGSFVLLFRTPVAPKSSMPDWVLTAVKRLEGGGVTARSPFLVRSLMESGRQAPK